MAAAIDAEVASIVEIFRRCYTPTDKEFGEDYAGMTRGERAEAIDARRRRCDHLMHDFMIRWSKAKVGKVVGGLMGEHYRFKENATVEANDFSGMGEEERAVEAARRRRNALEAARRLQMEGRPEGRWKEALARILDFDPKQLFGQYYNRFSDADLSKFDLDEESPIGPMRFTNQLYEKRDDHKQKLCEAINILSVKIASSDAGFPIHVYGTVIARDSIDKKCLYLFRRNKEHCQIINSEEESLILTGPKRGLMLLDYNYVEIDLKIKDHQGHERELSKGCVDICGVPRRSEEFMVGRESLATRLSTVDVIYAYMERAVEATIAIECVQGDFYGEITVHTDNISDNIVLYDSKLDSVLTDDGKGAIQLMRPVVAVSLKDKLCIVIQGGDGKPGRIIRFTARVNGGDQEMVFVGTMKMRVKVIWSVMDF